MYPLWKFVNAFMLMLIALSTFLGFAKILYCQASDINCIFWNDFLHNFFYPIVLKGTLKTFSFSVCQLSFIYAVLRGEICAKFKETFPLLQLWKASFCHTWAQGGKGGGNPVRKFEKIDLLLNNGCEAARVVFPIFSFLHPPLCENTMPMYAFCIQKLFC